MRKVYPVNRTLSRTMQIPTDEQGPTGPQGDSGVVVSGVVIDSGSFTADGSELATISSTSVYRGTITLFCVASGSSQGAPPRVRDIEEYDHFTVSFDPGDMSSYYWIMLPIPPF